MRGLLLLLMLMPVQALGGTLYLDPLVVDQGGATLLRWRGEEPSVALARCNDRLYYLRPLASGTAALLGADLDLEPGSYPIDGVVVDRRGEAQFFHLRLEVRRAARPEERLTLPPGKVTPRDPAVLRRIEAEQALLAELYARPESPPLWESFAPPVADPVSSPFGLRRILNGKPKSPHAGVDFRSSAGTIVHAAARGRVVFAGDLFFTGKTVVLDHGDGLISLYAHLQKIGCRSGELLEAGATLGRVGSTGRSTGPHLHWGVKLRGDRVDPLALAGLLAREKR